MKFIVKIVLGLFIIFLATPTIVTALDSDVNLSYFYNLGEEEESHSTFNEIKFIPSIFSIPLKIDFEGYQRIKFSILSDRKVNSIAPNIFLPPPELR
ncbi:hypothetical protein SY27_01970 [Flavobacterium sp. 316]|uniref:Gingipain propeptide domain-containing protein n=1 Tax=Flavobacterium sediminilitoris TaxID=2024526 RepID=A0ABY4HJA5_9FLAO|nr:MULTISPECIES: hypothetical protein [Flavobacterium]KIX22616.1 hypothetical protein SY27_01970 [Flavobacterium sp. 316]UOX32925.1 hypothetical protein LXD69_12865 [Flavobacterium sediminilitoris]